MAGRTHPHAAQPRPACPDGIADEHFEAGGRLHRHSNPLSLLVLGTLLGAAVLGQLGGTPNPHEVAETPRARLALEMPATVRNGEFLETRIAVTAHRPVAHLVLAVEPTLWHQLTINTTIPAAAQESYAAGRFRFDYGRLGAGETLRIKIDGQVNPALFGGTAGEIAVLDGDVPLAGLRHRMRVLP